VGHERGNPDAPLPWRRPASVYADALRAVEVLIENGGFVPDTKEQFAMRCDWTKPGTGGVDVPNARRVADVAAFLKDTAGKGDEAFGGMTVGYSPTAGGMMLIDPGGGDAMPLDHVAHMVLGDAQRQTQHKTENRRRLPVWQQAGRAFAATGDVDMARLCWRAENEVEQTGFVSATTNADLWKACRSRGFV
jgi:hypothetical protein